LTVHEEDSIKFCIAKIQRIRFQQLQEGIPSWLEIMTQRKTALK
jgi:hypothetical protein